VKLPPPVTSCSPDSGLRYPQPSVWNGKQIGMTVELDGIESSRKAPEARVGDL
jgi:hypothetical protein